MSSRYPYTHLNELGEILLDEILVEEIMNSMIMHWSVEPALEEISTQNGPPKMN